MAAPTFLQVLTREVSKMQAAYPDREAEVARACALIRLGMVTPSVEDPTEGRVLSSDGTTTYQVNGSCSCPSGLHGKQCKHVAAWKLYRYIVGKVEAAPAPVETPAPLPEAPCSANCHIMLAGRQVQLTLRDTDETRLLQRLQAVLAQHPLPQPAPPAQLSPQQHNALAQHQAVTGWCKAHHVAMKENEKDGRRWFSHRLPEGGFCKGK
jgi:hypothetical protein